MEYSTLLHIPHSSTVIPEQYLNSFYRSKLPHEIDVMTDWFCDELFECSRNKIIFPISRLVCDVERFRNDADEIMSKIGMGVTYRCASDLSSLRDITENERQDIIVRYYDTHHKHFTESVDKAISKFEQCLIIDCHSFYPSQLPYEICKMANRPDFCIGTSAYHTPKKIVENLVCFLSGSGYSVKLNSPFEGTIVPMKFYGKNKTVISVMIEVNRKLYLDAPGVKNSRFNMINYVLKECIKITEKALNT